MKRLLLLVMLLSGCAKPPEDPTPIFNRWVEPASEDNPIAHKLEEYFGPDDGYEFSSNGYIYVSTDDTWLQIPWIEDSDVLAVPVLGRLSFFYQDPEWHVQLYDPPVETAIRECKHDEDSGDDT